MINYRKIFNPSYNYIGIIIIIIITLTIFMLQKDTLESIYKISKISLTASSITLITGLMLNFVIEFFIVGSYKIFIEIITKNVIGNLYIYSLSLIVISGIVILVIKTIIKSKNTA